MNMKGPFLCLEGSQRVQMTPEEPNKTQISSSIVCTSQSPTYTHTHTKAGGNGIDLMFLDRKLNSKKMDVAVQLISNDKTVKNNTIHDLKDFNSQSHFTDVKKGEQLVATMPSI